MFFLLYFLLSISYCISQSNLTSNPRWIEMWSQEPCKCPKYLLFLPLNITVPKRGRCDCPLHLLRNFPVDPKDIVFFRDTPFSYYGKKIVKFNDSLKIKYPTYVNASITNISVTSAPLFDYLRYSKWWFLKTPPFCSNCSY